MKKIVLILSVFTLLLSCSDDITSLNKDTKNPTKVPAEFLFTNAQKALVDQMVRNNVNNKVFRLFVKQWTETTYTDESNYDIANRTITDNHFRALYRDVLKDLVESKKVLSSEVPVTPQEIAVSNNKKADQRLVFERGRRVEKGNHDSLIKKQGSYFALYEKQLLEEEAVS